MDWKKFPLRVYLLVFIIFVALISFFWMGGERESQEPIAAARHLRRCVAQVAAEEAAAMLGEGGGKVALLVPAPHEGLPFAGSDGADCDQGFREGIARFPKVTYLGYFPPEEMDSVERYQGFPPSLDNLGAVRKKFSDADLLVCFLGVPKIQGGDAELRVQRWLQSQPPQLLVVDSGTPRERDVYLALGPHGKGVVQRVLLRQKDLHYSKLERKATAREIFHRFYEVKNP